VGAKIMLTGTRTGELRKTAQYYAFEMELEGSKTAPKGLPLPSKSIQYTVFVSLKAGRKAKLESAPIDRKWLIQGELVLDVPVQDCPGEIGVVAFQIAELPSKQEQSPASDSPSEREVKAAQAEVAAAVSNIQAEPSTETSILQVKLENIQVPEQFLQTKLNPVKTDLLRKFVQKNGRIDKPIHLCREENTYWLVDGYRRYVVAREFGFDEVPALIETEKSLEELKKEWS
jgi:hypothetical protein